MKKIKDDVKLDKIYYDGIALRSLSVPDSYVAYTYSKDLTVLENIYALWNEMRKLNYFLESVVELVNAMVDFLNGEGLKSHVTEKLTEWLEDGTLEELINDTLFNTKADKVWVEGEFNETNIKINNDVQMLLEKIDILINEDGNLLGLINEIKIITDDPLKQKNIITTDFTPSTTLNNNDVVLVTSKKNNLLRYTLQRTGKDHNAYFPFRYEQGSLNASDGQIVEGVSRLRTIEYLSYGDVPFYFNFNSYEYSANIFYYNADKLYLSSTGWTKLCGLYTPPNNTRFIKLVFNLGSELNNNNAIYTDDILLIKPELWL